MTIGEVLQIEIWSKQATRRVLRGTWLAIRPVSIFLGCLALLMLVGYMIEARWLTSGERQAAIAALQKTEKLESIRFCRCEQFAVLNAGTMEAIEVARKKARTLRDGRDLELLELYRWQVAQDSEADLRFMEVEEFHAQHHMDSQSDPKFEEMRQNSMASVFKSLRDALHEELD